MRVVYGGETRNKYEINVRVGIRERLEGEGGEEVR